MFTCYLVVIYKKSLRKFCPLQPASKQMLLIIISNQDFKGHHRSYKNLYLSSIGISIDSCIFLDNKFNFNFSFILHFCVVLSILAAQPLEASRTTWGKEGCTILFSKRKSNQEVFVHGEWFFIKDCFILRGGEKCETPNSLKQP